MGAHRSCRHHAIHHDAIIDFHNRDLVEFRESFDARLSHQ